MALHQLGVHGHLSLQLGRVAGANVERKLRAIRQVDVRQRNRPVETVAKMAEALRSHSDLIAHVIAGLHAVLVRCLLSLLNLLLLLRRQLALEALDLRL